MSAVHRRVYVQPVHRPHRELGVIYYPRASCNIAPCCWLFCRASGTPRTTRSRRVLHSPSLPCVTFSVRRVYSLYYYTLGTLVGDFIQRDSGLVGAHDPSRSLRPSPLLAEVSQAPDRVRCFLRFTRHTEDSVHTLLTLASSPSGFTFGFAPSSSDYVGVPAAPLAHTGVTRRTRW